MATYHGIYFSIFNHLKHFPCIDFSQVFSFCLLQSSLANCSTQMKCSVWETNALMMFCHPPASVVQQLYGQKAIQNYSVHKSMLGNGVIELLKHRQINIWKAISKGNCWFDRCRQLDKVGEIWQTRYLSAFSYWFEVWWIFIISHLSHLVELVVPYWSVGTRYVIKYCVNAYAEQHNISVAIFPWTENKRP